MNHPFDSPSGLEGQGRVLASLPGGCCWSRMGEEADWAASLQGTSCAGSSWECDCDAIFMLHPVTRFKLRPQQRRFIIAASPLWLVAFQCPAFSGLQWPSIWITGTSSPSCPAVWLLPASQAPNHEIGSPRNGSSGPLPSGLATAAANPTPQSHVLSIRTTC